MTTSFKMYLIRRQQAAKQHMCVGREGGKIAQNTLLKQTEIVIN